MGASTIEAPSKEGVKVTMSTKSSRKLKAEKTQQKLESWKPNASEIQLFDVPAEQRELVRTRLKPFLNGLKTVASYFDTERTPLVVRGRDCWETAQALVLHAMDPGIVYVEGAWKHLPEKHASSAPHGWVTVDGYTVDLVQEFYARRDGSCEIEREPLRTFTHVELEKVLGDIGDWEPVSPLLWAKNKNNWKKLPARFKKIVNFDERPDGTYGTDAQRAEQSTLDDELNSLVFKLAYDSAVAKLNARLEAEGLG
jgi:hypothetical protein